MTSLTNDLRREKLFTSLESFIEETILACVAEAIQGAMEEAKDDGSLAELAEKAIEAAIDGYDFDKVIIARIENAGHDLQDVLDAAIKEVNIPSRVDDALENADFGDLVRDDAIACVEEATKQLFRSSIFLDRVSDIIHERMEAYFLSDEFQEKLGNALESTQAHMLQDSDFLANLAEHVAMILEARKPLPFWKRAVGFVRAKLGW